MSGASEGANGRASDPVLQSVFLAIIDHSAIWWLMKYAFIAVRSYTEIAQDIPAAIQAKGSVVKAVKLMGDTVIDQVRTDFDICSWLGTGTRWKRWVG